MLTLTFRSVADVDAPADEAWSVLARYELDPSWRTGVTEMIPDPSGLVVDRTRTRETLRILGRVVRSTAVVDDVRPGASFRWTTVNGSDADGMRSVHPIAPGRCRIVLDKRVRLSGLDVLIAPLAWWIIRRDDRRDARRVARLIESRSTGVAAD